MSNDSVPLMGRLLDSIDPSSEEVDAILPSSDCAYVNVMYGRSDLSYASLQLLIQLAIPSILSLTICSGELLWFGGGMDKHDCQRSEQISAGIKTSFMAKIKLIV